MAAPLEHDPRLRDMQLPDGRRLAWTEIGPADGMPVLYLHGGNDCGLEAAWFAKSLRPHIRIIAPDRPGFGESTFQAGRRFSDVVVDVEHLLDALGIDRLPAFGLSGGGPHVLALAALSTRVSRAAVVASPSPLDRGLPPGLWFPIRLAYLLARHAPDWLLRLFQRAMNDPERNMRYANRMPPPDAALFREDPARKQAVIASVTRAHAHGFDGAVLEWRLYTRAWDFDPSTIRIPTTLWYGDADGMAPPTMGEQLAALIPGAELRVLENEAHLSLIHHHAGTVVDELTAHP